jgi:hypothetical protein
MTTIPYHFAQPTRVMPAVVGVSVAAQRPIAGDQASPAEGVDPQERRWQLEWDRRNVED